MVGAGPAGLTAARDLALRGYAVTVFEELPDPGGMLRWAIPSYRLPRNILAGEIDDIRRLGVEIRCNVRVGKDLPFDKLGTDFDYVYLATGAHKSTKMDVPGEDLQGVWGGVEFLRAFNLDEDAWMKGTRTLGSRVAVIGGGNSAIDAARCAKRMGADVTILYRRERKEMPAAEEEVAAALDEDIRIEFLAAPLRIEGKDGKVSGITCERMRLGDFDRSGPPAAHPHPGLRVHPLGGRRCGGHRPGARHGLRSQGQRRRHQQVELLRPGRGEQVPDDESEVLRRRRWVTGPDTVIGAIAAGHRAAADIDAGIRAAAANRWVLRRRRRSMFTSSTTRTQEHPDEKCRSSTSRPEHVLRRGRARIHPVAGHRGGFRCLRCDAKYRIPQSESIARTTRGHCMSQVTLTIDNRKVSVEPGTTILNAAKQAGVPIPTLCAMQEIGHTPGACRVCMVEVEGQRGLVAACVFPVNEGMVVKPTTDRVRNARKLVESFFSPITP